MREAYLSVRKSEPEDRPAAVETLLAAAEANESGGSCLALAKGYLYLAIDASKAPTKFHREYMVRDEKVVAFLKKATAVALEGAENHRSSLCLVSLPVSPPV